MNKMRKVRIFILLTVLFIPLCGIVAFLSMPRVQVVGNIQAEDLTLIKTAVRQVTARPIIRVEVQTDGTVEAFFRETQLGGDCGYVLKKEPAGWNVKATLFR